MVKPKQIPHPDLKNARKLTPLQLNALKCSRRHTLLTPEILENFSAGKTPGGDA